MKPLPRYWPQVPWPRYAYRPGHDPHPTRDPRGHSHGEAEDDRPAEAPADWARSPRYLRGVDLYNHGFGWEAHEVWESLWHRPVDRVQAAWLQTLIQLAAATVQERIDHPDGRRRLCLRALDHLRRVQESGATMYMGVVVAELDAALRVYARDPAHRPVLRLSESDL